LREAVDGYLLSCKVEGKSLATVHAYRSKLYPFLWYCRTYNLPDDIADISTQDIRGFLAYLRDNAVRFGGKSTLSRRPVNGTTVLRYYRVLSGFWNWLLLEELAVENPLARIRTPKPEKKVIKGLAVEQINRLLAYVGNDYDGKRNRTILLVLVDCGLRLGELTSLRLEDVDMERQVISVSGKTGERVVRFGRTTARALLSYLIARSRIDGSNNLWISLKGQRLTSSGVQTLFNRLSVKSGIKVQTHFVSIEAIES